MASETATASGGRSARAEARRGQVVEAARECFRRYGFHGASMVQIAAEAGMSVGQIYRFFSGKEAIIEAIVEEGVAQKMDHIAGIEQSALDSGEDLAMASARARAELSAVDDRDQDALILEIVAEAARNPAVAAIVQENDKRFRERAEQMVAAARPHWPAARVSDVVRMIAALHEGWYLRLISDPGTCKASADELRARLIACALQP